MEELHLVWIRSNIKNTAIYASHTDTVPDFNEKFLLEVRKEFPHIQLKINYLEAQVRKNDKYYRLADNSRIFSVFNPEKKHWYLRANISIISKRSSKKKRNQVGSRPGAKRSTNRWFALTRFHRSKKSYLGKVLVKKSHVKSVVDLGFNELELVPHDQTVTPQGPLTTCVEFPTPDPENDANSERQVTSQVIPDCKEKEIETSLQGTNDVKEILQDDLTPEIEIKTRVVARRLFPTETEDDNDDGYSNANTWNPSDSLRDNLVNGNESIGSVVGKGGTSTKTDISMLEQSKKPKVSSGWSSSDEESNDVVQVVPDTPEHLINNHRRGTRRSFWHNIMNNN